MPQSLSINGGSDDEQPLPPAASQTALPLFKPPLVTSLNVVVVGGGVVTDVGSKQKFNTTRHNVGHQMGHQGGKVEMLCSNAR